jgi:parvulin-like peptidyl-prolyl isomerase
MVQKMDFLAEDLSDLRQPSREELAAWFAKNTGHFTLPGRVSFRHLYFSFDKHGQKTAEAAAEVLKQITGKPADSPEAAALADAFMFQDYYGDRSFDEIAKTFGPGFARGLFELKAGSWQGPIESGYGWHLVFIDSLTPARVPEFEEVENDVKTAWMGQQRAEFKRKAFEAMRSRYEIVLPKASADAAPVTAASPAQKGGS